MGINPGRPSSPQARLAGWEWPVGPQRRAWGSDLGPATRACRRIPQANRLRRGDSPSRVAASGPTICIEIRVRRGTGHTGGATWQTVTRACASPHTGRSRSGSAGPGASSGRTLDKLGVYSSIYNVITQYAMYVDLYNLIFLYILRPNDFFPAAPARLAA